MDSIRPAGRRSVDQEAANQDFHSEAGKRAQPLAEKHWAEQWSELLAALRARDEFISIAAHELRNPMAALLLQVQGLLLASQRGPAVPDLPARLTMLERRVRTFINRATTLLDVSRLSGGAYPLRPEPVSLDEVFQVVLEELGPEAAMAGCTLVPRLQPGIVGSWDRLAVTQVLSNLVANAIKYGGGQPVDLNSWAQGGRAFLQVIDRGIGISQDDQARVFAEFERAVKRRQHGGFGLGLWITRQLVERMKGGLAIASVASVVDQGSTFTVQLPLGPASVG
jgi:two-component system, OmpR family, sensor kinase